jgi:hypothetical protein
MSAVKETSKIGEGKPGPGRPKGVPNKQTAQVKEMILAALDKAGGVDYLAAQAAESPAAFMTLVGKVLPLQVTGDADNPLRAAIEVRFIGNK